ncbi:transposase IS66-like protein [Nitrosomonas eutropha]|uniref:Transposase IS66-like protein n=1 Tax=Nitrosomonas eutropha TaxID=916 RepID=A0ABX5M6H4_9PROT|nr:transposase IS66-like protein [Nitrosomonas eutropha]SEJ35026.1 IS66 C-terminal element [Nitrosomonas eutropha]
MGDCIAELNGLNPSVWLKDTLIKLPAWPNNRIDELLPLPPEFIEVLRKKWIEIDSGVGRLRLTKEDKLYTVQDCFYSICFTTVRAERRAPSINPWKSEYASPQI